MRRAVMITLVVLLSGVTNGSAQDTGDILDQKKELEQIKQDVQDSQRRLDSLRSVEEKVTRQMSEYDQRIASDRKLIGRLNRELNDLKSAIGQSEDRLAAHEALFEQTRRRYLGNIRQSYFATRRTELSPVEQPNGELAMHRKVVYLTAVAGFESGNVEQAELYLAESVEDLEDLTGQRKLVTNLKKEKEISYSLGQSQKEKTERSLDRLKRLKQDEADRMLTLRQAAADMEKIIARLEEASRQNQYPQTDVAPSVFAALKGQLRMPHNGKVIVPFGLSTDKITRLKSYSPGIVIKGKAGVPVRLVASGTVAYTGNLRGYGNFVIIRHDSRHYTTYAGLGRVNVSEGQHLAGGSSLGTSGDNGEVRFELRAGREALDPVEWIKFEAL
ncbi:peptidoglycan DD-metalloendopeptidase family protein [candidate division GN15 bacterium]|nr:peptidoglycan DD-metalloendopeptidase family protein [candidate division GN15 bacterium]